MPQSLPMRRTLPAFFAVLLVVAAFAPAIFKAENPGPDRSVTSCVFTAHTTALPGILCPVHFRAGSPLPPPQR